MNCKTFSLKCVVIYSVKLHGCDMPFMVVSQSHYHVSHNNDVCVYSCVCAIVILQDMIKWILLSVGFIIIFLSILGIATGGTNDYIGAVITTFLVSRLYWNNYYTIRLLLDLSCCSGPLHHNVPFIHLLFFYLFFSVKRLLLIICNLCYQIWDNRCM